MAPTPQCQPWLCLQAWDMHSPATDVITAGFSAAQWQRVSAAHVRCRSATDCKVGRGVRVESGKVGLHMWNQQNLLGG